MDEAIGSTRQRQRGRLATKGLLLLCAAASTGASTAVSAAASDASTVYVTDELRLGLYNNEQTDGRPFKTLVSGAKLVVLDRALMSIRVRTEDGSEGWTKVAYLVETEPARRRVALLEQRQLALEEELQTTHAALAGATSRSSTLESDLKDAESRNATVPELEMDNARLRESLSAFSSSVPVHWLLAAAAIAFALGCGAGYWWLDRRVRRQFGGVRVY